MDTNPPEDNTEFEALKRLADDGELTAETLNAKLNSYAEAYRQEFETDSKADPDNVEEYTRDYFKKNIHVAAAQIVWLSVNSTSESVMLNASKYVIDAALKDAEAMGDPIRELMKSLQKNDATSPSPTEQS
jgi:hypothetical protein